MDILGLMLKAVRGTVEEQVQRALEGMGLAGQAPEAAAPEKPEPEPAAEEPVPSFEVVDALFPGASRAPEAPAAAAPADTEGAESNITAPATMASEPPPAAPSVPASQQAASPDAGVPAPDGGGAGDESSAEARAQEEADTRAVLTLLERRGTPQRGYGIAEGTGISPWWRLKDVLQRLTSEGRVVQTEDGLFALGPDADRSS